MKSLIHILHAQTKVVALLVIKNEYLHMSF